MPAVRAQQAFCINPYQTTTYMSADYIINNGTAEIPLSHY